MIGLYLHKEGLPTVPIVVPDCRPGSVEEQGEENEERSAPLESPQANAKEEAVTHTVGNSYKG